MKRSQICLLNNLSFVGQLSSDVTIPDANRKIFFDLLSDLKKGLKRSADKQSLVLPLECHYLNKNAFLSVVGTQPQTSKHFSLRRKPKAAALRAELMNKSQEAQNKIKASGGIGGLSGFPMRKSTMPRKMSDMPMKGLPSRTLGTSGFNRNPRVPQPTRTDRRKEVGVKLLEITDQPLGYAAMKKKRKQEMEDAKKLAAEAEAAKAAQVQAEKAEHVRQSKQSKIDVKNQGGAAQKSAIPGPTPDYAAGLSSLNPATPAGLSTNANQNMIVSVPSNQLINPPPAYAPPTPTPINIQSQATARPSYALPATTIIRTAGPPGNLNPLPPPPQLQPANTSTQNLHQVVNQPPPLLVMQQPQLSASQQSTLLSQVVTTAGTISGGSNLSQQQKLQQQQAEILARAQQQLQQQAAAKGQTTTILQSPLRATQQQLPFGIKSSPGQTSTFQVQIIGHFLETPTRTRISMPLFLIFQEVLNTAFSI